jgi:hypothetical protein
MIDFRIVAAFKQIHSPLPELELGDAGYIFLHLLDFVDSLELLWWKDWGSNPTSF